MEHRTREDHLLGDGPKRILALDGGGIRGALTLGYLARIEEILRDRHGGDPDFRLSDYFDLIGGTSTGSIIATGLALGFAVDELVELYRSLGDKVFDKGLLRFGLFGAKFAKEPLLDALDRHFGDVTLGGDEVRTGLMVMTKRLDTGSPWLLHNSPRGRYFSGQDNSYPNQDFLLRNIVRASTAAPHYFEPEMLQIAPGMAGAFVDGGVSPYNNPALQTLMLATCAGYGLSWPFGEDKLLLVSAGTGLRQVRMPAADVMDMPAVVLAAQSMLSIMADANWLGQAVLQWMSSSPTAWSIDGEVGDLREDRLGGGPDMISYLRYEVALESQWLADNLGLNLDEAACDELYAMDNPRNLAQLSRIGVAAAAQQVQPDHFPVVFDLS